MSVPDFTPDQMNNQNEEEKGDESNDELFYPEDGKRWDEMRWLMRW